MATKEFEGQDVRVLDLIGDEHPAWLEGYTFRDCNLTGPAVLMIVEGVTINGCRLSPEALWALDNGRAYSGGIGVRSSQFLGCSFTDVGIAGPHELIQEIFDTKA